MEQKRLWETQVSLDSVDGVYIHNGHLWIHDGQWRSELLDLGSGETVRSLTLCPSWEDLRRILTEDALRWRLQVEPVIIGPNLLLSVTNSSVRQDAGEFGLITVKNWETEDPLFEPLHYRSGPRADLPYARGVHQGAFKTPDGRLGLLTAHQLYDTTTQEFGPYRFSFYVVDEDAHSFDLFSQVTHEGSNMGNAYRNLSIPEGWVPRRPEQPTCFDWSQERSVWTYRATMIEAIKTDRGFEIRANGVRIQ